MLHRLKQASIKLKLFHVSIVSVLLLFPAFTRCEAATVKMSKPSFAVTVLQTIYSITTIANLQISIVDGFSCPNLPGDIWNTPACKGQKLFGQNGKPASDACWKEIAHENFRAVVCAGAKGPFNLQTSPSAQQGMNQFNKYVYDVAFPSRVEISEWARYGNKNSGVPLYGGRVWNFNCPGKN